MKLCNGAYLTTVILTILVWSSTSSAKAKRHHHKKAPNNPSLSEKRGIAQSSENQLYLASFVDYETIALNGVSLSGLGFAGLIGDEIMLSPTISIPIAGGFHYTSTSKTENGLAVKLSLQSLLFEGGVAFKTSPRLSVGGLLSYDFGLNGSYSVASEYISASKSVTASSRLALGLAMLFRVSRTLSIGGEIASVASGSIQVEGGESTSISGLRAGVRALVYF